MRKGLFNGLISAKLQEHSGDKSNAFEAVGHYLDDEFAEKKIDTKSVSIKQLFEEIVDPQRRFSEKTDSQKIAEAVASTAFPTITNSVIHATIIPNYMKYIGDMDSLVRERPASKTETETIAGFTSVDGLEKRSQSMAYEQGGIGEKKVAIKMADFGKIIDLTAEALFDDRTGELVDRATDIGIKGGQLRGRIITQTIEGNPRTAFGETAFGGFNYNGSELTKTQFYSSDHASVADGKKNANVDTTALSSNALDAHGINFQALVDEEGDEIGAVPNTLLVPPALQTKARKLLFSGTDPETVAADINVFKGAYAPIIGRYLTSTENFFIGDFKQQLLWLWVWEPATAFQGNTSELSFTNQIVSRYRFNWNGGVGHTDYRFIHRGGATP